ncbi:MAG: hypothetical protein QNJ54_03320 [Prochloraceae cyanobacterium]|nr:hypothetical protein [Prochloraceae cyanobacterium]
MARAFSLNTIADKVSKFISTQSKNYQTRDRDKVEHSPINSYQLKVYEIHLWVGCPSS